MEQMEKATKMSSDKNNDDPVEPQPDRDAAIEAAARADQAAAQEAAREYLEVKAYRGTTTRPPAHEIAFLTTFALQYAEQRHAELNETVRRLLAERDEKDATILRYELALKNCRMTAARAVHGRAVGATGIESWEAILRFCKEVGIKGSLLRGDDQ